MKCLTCQLIGTRETRECSGYLSSGTVHIMPWIEVLQKKNFETKVTNSNNDGNSRFANSDK